MARMTRLAALGMTIAIFGAGLALLNGGQAAAQAQIPWQQYEGLTSLEIPFANGPISAEHVPQVWLKLRGAEPRWFGLDTSTLR